LSNELNSLPNQTEQNTPSKSVSDVKKILDETEKGIVKNTIKNCLTVLEQDSLLKGAIRTNILTERIDIVKPLGWERSGSAMTDTDMKYLELYLEENYQLTSEKKIDDAIRIVANENKYHPICDFLNSLQWDRTERIRYARMW